MSQAAPLRIALISAPRSGNTWVRDVIARSLCLEQYAVHRYWDMPKPLPSRCIMQIHWRRDARFKEYIDGNKFKVITIARHPLDILASILQFSQYCDEVDQWLDGNAGKISALKDSNATCDQFKEFALSPEYAHLLGVTLDWWADPSSKRLRYEELVSKPQKLFYALCKDYGCKRRDVKHAIAIHASDVLPVLRKCHHFWTGNPGAGRLQIPLSLRLRVYIKHYKLFHALGYGMN